MRVRFGFVRNWKGITMAGIYETRAKQSSSRHNGTPQVDYYRVRVERSRERHEKGDEGTNTPMTEQQESEE